MNLLETDSLSNQNISARLQVGSYTADAERLIFVRAFADQIQGNGIYTCDLTIQRGGAGSTYRVQPATAVAVPSGVTSAAWTSTAIPVSSGDVLTVSLTGLSTDTTTPDTVVEWWEDEGGGGGGLDAAGVRAAVGLAAANLDIQLGDLPTNAELDAALAGADDAVLTAIAALADLDAAGAQAAAEAALAAYAPLLSADYTAPDNAGIAAAQAAIAALNDIAAADVLAAAVEGGLDVGEVLRVILAFVAGKASGADTDTVTFRDQADSKDRLVMTVDEDGNRSLVLVDGS